MAARDAMMPAPIASCGSDARLAQELAGRLGVGRVACNVPMTPRTTLRAGGAADWFLETGDSREVVCAVQAAGALGLPLTILGGGSNVLVGDGGVRGLVVCIRRGAITHPEPEIVRADAGVSINALVRWCVSRGLAGIEAWAGTPGTVGGAVAGNAHFHGALIGDHIRAVRTVERQGRERRVPAEEMDFGYDRSRLPRTGEVVLWAEFRVAPANPVRLRAAARESLRFRKRTQPLAEPSAGCIFRNPDADDPALPPDLPASAGALIEAAGLKDRAIGRARVSARHCNFIVGDGSARAADIRALIEECRETVHERFGVRLRDEIVYLGEF